MEIESIKSEKMKKYFEDMSSDYMLTDNTIYCICEAEQELQDKFIQKFEEFIEEWKYTQIDSWMIDEFKKSLK